MDLGAQTQHVVVDDLVIKAFQGRSMDLQMVHFLTANFVGCLNNTE